MKGAQIESLADMLETTWSKVYYRKYHRSLVGTLYTLMADCSYDDVIEIIRDYANNYDNAPNVATLSKLAHMPKENKADPANSHRLYLEDSDGCGYMWNGQTKDYDCIWKWWWADKGLSKMRVLKEHGLANY